jgi:hypothetical protein
VYSNFHVTTCPSAITPSTINLAAVNAFTVKGLATITIAEKSTQQHLTRAKSVLATPLTQGPAIKPAQRKDNEQEETKERTTMSVY